MLKNWKSVALAAVVLASATVTGTAKAADSDASIAAGEAETKQLLRLMDKDQNGKVSKEEFIKFMETEFDRLDTSKDGELDVAELLKMRTQSYGGSSHR